jgi:hypothetical protein
MKELRCIRDNGGACTNDSSTTVNCCLKGLSISSETSLTALQQQIL